MYSPPSREKLAIVGLWTDLKSFPSSSYAAHQQAETALKHVEYRMICFVHFLTAGTHEHLKKRDEVYSRVLVGRIREVNQRQVST